MGVVWKDMDGTAIDLTGNTESKYVGQYKDNKRNGQGTMTYANGTVKKVYEKMMSF